MKWFVLTKQPACKVNRLTFSKEPWVQNMHQIKISDYLQGINGKITEQTKTTNTK